MYAAIMVEWDRVFRFADFAFYFHIKRFPTLVNDVTTYMYDDRLQSRVIDGLLQHQSSAVAAEVQL